MPVVTIIYLQVSFIAINCWSGTCSLHHKLDLYPKLVAIHSHFDGVEYKGVHKTFRMVSNTQLCDYALSATPDQ